ncbi:MAG: type II secretion system F family protein [Kiritimatiellia bacterium]
MKTFRYNGYDRDGRSRNGIVEAADTKEARQQLLKQGLLTERLSEVGLKEATGGSGRLSLDGRAILYRELATLIRAGVALLTAMQSLGQIPEFDRARLRLAAARDRIREGAGLGEALQSADLGLQPFERAAIEAGLRAGRMEESLDRLASYLQEQQELRSKIGAALTYPVVVLAFSLVVAVVMLGFVLPNALAMIQRAGVKAELPLLTRIMLRVRDTAMWLAPLLLAGVMWLGVFIRRRIRTSIPVRMGLDRLAFRVPFFGSGYRLLVNLRFARTFSLVLRGGVAAEEGLVMAGRACGSAWVEQRSVEEGEAVRHGSNLADAVRRIPPLEPFLPSWIQTGETAGALSDMLDHAANRLQQQWNRYVGRLLGLLEPILILLVGGLVFLVVLSIILPLIRMNTGLLD